MHMEKNLCDFKEKFVQGDYDRCINICDEYLAREVVKSGLSISNESVCVNSTSEKICDKCQTWCRWAVEQNSIVVKMLIHILKMSLECHEESAKFPRMFHDKVIEMHTMPPSEPHLSMELVCLHNYLVFRLLFNFTSFHVWSNEAWPLIYEGLSRVLNSTAKSKNKTENVFYGSSDISTLLRCITCNSLSNLTFESLCYFCFTFAWVVALEKNHSNSVAVIETLKHLSKVHKKQLYVKDKKSMLCIISRMNTLSRDDGLPINNMKFLLLACAKINDCKYGRAINYLDRISYLEWKYFIEYMKAFSHYQAKNYSSAKSVSMKIWKDKSRVDRPLVAMVCNLVGCCYFAEKKYAKSEKWFIASGDLNSSFLLHLSNLSLCHLKKSCVLEATEALNCLVEKAMGCATSYTCLVFNTLTVRYEPEVNHVEALYLCGHHFLTLQCYSKACNIFAKLCSNFKHHQLQIFVRENGENISAFRVYIDAAYAFLHAELYDKCLEVCKFMELLDPTNCNMLAANLLINLKSCDQNNSSDDEAEHQNSLGISGKSKCVADIFKSNPHQSENMFYLSVRMLITSSVLFHSSDIDGALTSLQRASALASDALERKRHISNTSKMKQVTDDMGISDTSSSDIASCGNSPTFFDDVFQSFDAKNNRADDVSFEQKFSDIVVETLNASGEMKSKDVQLLAKNEKCLLSQIHNNMAVCLIAAGQISEASQYLKIALDFDPDNIDVIFNCCLMDLKHGNTQNARDLWSNAKARIPLINTVLLSAHYSFPYNVSLDQLRTLEAHFNDINDAECLCLDFDISWDDF